MLIRSGDIAQLVEFSPCMHEAEFDPQQKEEKKKRKYLSKKEKKICMFVPKN